MCSLRRRGGVTSRRRMLYVSTKLAHVTPKGAVMNRGWIGLAASAFGVSFCLASGCNGSVTSAASATATDGGVDDTGSLNEAGMADTSADDANALTSTPDCFDSDDVCNFTPPAAPRAHQAVCTADQIADFYTACIVDMATGADGGNPRTSFVAANGSCASCFFGSSDLDGGPALAPTPVITSSQQTGDYGVDLRGCVAAISSGTPECKQAYDLRSLCSTGACFRCSASDTSACVAWGTTDPSSPFVSAYSSTQHVKRRLQRFRPPNNRRNAGRRRPTFTRSTSS